MKTFDGLGLMKQNPCKISAVVKFFGRNLVLFISLSGFSCIVTQVKAQPAALLSVRNPSVPLPSGGDDNSAAPILSADGRYVVFSSAANNLVPGGNSFIA